MKKNIKNPLILSIDLEEWYHGRWATGSPNSRWKDVQSFFQDYYKADKPIGEVIEPVRRILNLLKKERVKATFFVLGEVAQWYPDLVKEIASQGHEIACHGMHHRDLTLYSPEQFSKELIQSRQILEKLSGRPVIGFRVPNLLITEWLPKILIKQGFTYDSSVCPGREIQGKYKGQTGAPKNPYRADENSLLLRGESQWPCLQPKPA